MATTPAPPGKKQRYRLLRVALSPHLEAEAQINQVADEGYVLKGTVPDGSQAMVCLFELAT
ncbi:MAG TPA: hypothetical protein VFA71_03950 [Terriglobales bacterium]|nr:hypothetical protein [Terriglobales bacterium]